MPKKTKQITEEAHNSDLIVYSALVGVSMVAVIQLLSINKLSLALNISLYCFAIAIPFNIVSIASIFIEKEYKLMVITLYKNIYCYGAIILTIMGVSSLFFHFSPWLGLIFLTSSMIGFFTLLKYYWDLEKVNTENDK